MSYPGHSLGGWGSYPSAEMQLGYSTALADRALVSLWLLALHYKEYHKNESANVFHNPNIYIVL